MTEEGLVAILDGENFSQLFATSNPMRVTVRESKRLTKFQVEDGTERSDHVVQDAIEIAIDLILEEDDARDQYQQIRQAWLDNRLVVVQTKVNSYESMLIVEMPHDETPELGDGIALPIKLQEWRPIKPQYGSLPPTKVANKKQADTTKGGQKQTTDANSSKAGKASVLYGVFN